LVVVVLALLVLRVLELALQEFLALFQPLVLHLLQVVDLVAVEMVLVQMVVLAVVQALVIQLQQEMLAAIHHQKEQMAEMALAVLEQLLAVVVAVHLSLAVIALQMAVLVEMEHLIL
jgi:hypothetical protein